MGTDPGTLLVCGAPIGNPADASPRLVQALATADVVAAEDTRRLRRLAVTLGVAAPGRVVSYFEGNEAARTVELLGELRRGATVALVTDAGMPGVSDPGYRLVSAAAAEGMPVRVVPGPSAVTAALAVSGLPSDRWVFEGFLPRRAGERRARLAELTGERRTLVLLEAPHRLRAALSDLVEAFGAQRPAALCRELTKAYEEVVRGGLGALAARVSERDVRGEITLVVAGAPAASTAAVQPRALAAAVAAREATGMPRKAAIAAVAAEHGRPKRDVYDAVIAAKPGC